MRILFVTAMSTRKSLSRIYSIEAAFRVRQKSDHALTVRTENRCSDQHLNVEIRMVRQPNSPVSMYYRGRFARVVPSACAKLECVTFHELAEEV